MRTGLATGLAIGTVALLSGLSACSDQAAACAEPVSEQLDPNSLLHVIDPQSARYASDTPTSGPHLAVLAPEGVLNEPVAPAMQVTILERGDVLIQYRDAKDLAVLSRLAGPRAVIAPQPGLAERVVATAWTTKLTCSGLDSDVLADFIAARADKGPQH